MTEYTIEMDTISIGYKITLLANGEELDWIYAKPLETITQATILIKEWLPRGKVGTLASDNTIHTYNVVEEDYFGVDKLLNI